MRQTPILSDLELAILGRIRDEPQSGYALRKTLAASPGAVYPAIRRLAAAGLISGREEATGGRRRETFQITPAGRRALRESLDGPALDEVRRDPDAVASRLRFIDGPAAGGFLEEFARLCAACAAERKQDRSLESEYLVAVYTARSRWAASAAKRLRR